MNHWLELMGIVRLGIALKQLKEFKMLVLSRRPNELIYIYPDDLPPDMTVAELFAGGQIVIEVLSIEQNQVKIGIDAPKHLTILRDNANERT